MIMSVNRIQKLLFSEYCDFEDMVLVESPFAETTRDGTGIRQVHIGLTPTKLVVATDVIPSAEESNVWCLQDIDPETDTFELISVYPIECVNLSIFRRRKRQSLKAHFCNNRVTYFELGGFEKKKMFWNLWCERVKFLCPNDLNSTRSETSAGSSTSNSTLYLVKSQSKYPQNKIPQLWCTFGVGDNIEMKGKWAEKDLYLGNESPKSLIVKFSQDSIMNVQKADECSFRHIKKETHSPENVATNIKNTIPQPKIKYFRKDPMGIHRREKSIEPDKNLANKVVIDKAIWRYQIINTIENSVFQWETDRKVQNYKSIEIRHRRRYAFNPQPHFYYGLGPWNIRSGERYSVQVKRVVSDVKIHRPPDEPELRLPVSKRQLTASISLDALINKSKMINSILVNSSCWNKFPTMPIKIFWTPEYWYRPRTPRDVYQELRSHLKKIKHYHQERTAKDIFTLPDKHKKETPMDYLRRMLCLNNVLSIWDFDSTTLAYQLTIIDRDLFMKVTEIELGVVVFQQSCKNAPNIAAIIAFSHRVCCLVSTEIIKQDSERLRGRLICRFISIADKCNRICNFQSCKSILNGLQSPPVYRLHLTWSYVRQKHSSKYHLFEKLCRLYRDPRLPIYQRAFCRARRNCPYLPYIGDILFHLMDKIPKIYKKNAREHPNDVYVLQKQKDDLSPPIQRVGSFQTLPTSSIPNMLRRFLSTFRVLPSHHNLKASNKSDDTVNVQCSSDNELIENYGSEDDCDTLIVCHEDNRKEVLNEVTELLKIFQKSASHYALCMNELANDFLLKVRYRESKENFFLSFQIEAKRC